MPISFPRSLTLDPLSSALLVVGLGGSVLYKIGADHRLDGKQGAHLVVDIRDKTPDDDAVYARRPAQAKAEGGADPPEQRRRRRHASRAFIPKNAIRQWSSAPPEDFGEALASQERAEAGGAARLSASANDEIDDAASVQGTGTAKGWLKARGSLSPGGDRAVVWVDGVGMYAVSFAGGLRGELLGVDSGATDLVVVGGDSGGWLLGVTAGGKMHVWRPVSANKSPAGGMGAAAALKLRARQAAGLDGDAPPSSHVGDGDTAKSREKGPEGLQELLVTPYPPHLSLSLSLSLSQTLTLTILLTLSHTHSHSLSLTLTLTLTLLSHTLSHTLSLSHTHTHTHTLTHTDTPSSSLSLTHSLAGAGLGVRTRRDAARRLLVGAEQSTPGS